VAGSYLRAVWISVFAALVLAGGARAQSVEDLQRMSLDDLADVDVTSAAKAEQALSDAPAAIYVISHEDIVRSGALTVPQMLRLAPNLFVAETGANHFVITARGFSGNNQAQAFSDKLLVLVDGRTVYNPLFSGVYWDAQDVLPDDIDRIEVISGPGAALWGANAVNGVINIITRPAAQTQGGVIVAGGGNQVAGASLRYGGRIGEHVAWRAYARGLVFSDTVDAAGARAHNNTSKPQGGVRLDWSAGPADAVTLQGDVYSGAEARPTGPDEFVRGGNIMTRWTHDWRGGASLQVQAYYDRTERGGTEDGGRFRLNLWDLDVQHDFALGARQQIVWGGGVRLVNYRIDGSSQLLFDPPRRTLTLGNVFVQDSLALSSRLTLTLGLKLEKDAYAEATVLPSARLAWKPDPRALVWAAVSRAVRAPTPFDRDVVEKVGSLVFLDADGHFRAETLTAWEAGVRLQPTPRLSFSVSGFYNVYDDLRSIEATPVVFLPITWGNGMRGHTWGVEAWGDWRVADWWRLSAAFSVLRERLAFKPASSGLLGIAQAGDDPPEQASLRSSMNLGSRVTLDTDLRYVAALPDPAVPGYVELGAALAWNVTGRAQLSLVGANLLHARHQEFPSPANAVPRSVYAQLRLRF
jgi:iron complex outermembrane receptor protein